MKRYWVNDIVYVIEDEYGYIIGTDNDKKKPYHVRMYIRKLDNNFYYVNVHVRRLNSKREKGNYMVLRKYDTIELDAYGEEAKKRYMILEKHIKQIIETKKSK